jgi:hypothetical protein
LFSAALSLQVAITSDRVIRLSSQPGYSLSHHSQVDPGLVLTQDLGFPVIQLQVIIVGASWDAGIYNRIRQFHEGKGSNPYSEEVALAIGYPLFQLSCD